MIDDLLSDLLTKAGIAYGVLREIDTSGVIADMFVHR